MGRTVMTDGEVVLKKWMVAGVLTIITATFGAAMWIFEIESKVDNGVAAIPNIERDVGTALQVLADHGTELQGIRDLHVEFLGALNLLRADMGDKTKLRYTSEDAADDWELHKREHEIERRERMSP